MKDGSLCGKTLKEMNCHKASDGNGSKKIKARCESLVESSFFKRSTTKAHCENVRFFFFLLGFALNEPWTTIKTRLYTCVLNL